ncbi:hypothetical protein BXY64_3756 [Marinifilum flexuosum]|uniref:Uncharacterized protein n=1 Tax=Marinifilum flexuosum TaxID=1117708 RepID=A0A419WMW9_9BACT|nr:hypothetical protein BXY64_3756 [Marinifilum flexuosum]
MNLTSNYGSDDDIYHILHFSALKPLNFSRNTYTDYHSTPITIGSVFGRFHF